MVSDEAHVTVALGIVSVAFLCGFWFAPGGVLALRQRAGGELQVDLRFFYTPGTLYRLLDLYGVDGRRSFRNLHLADMIFPAVYAATLYSLGGLIAFAHPFAAAVVRCAAIAAALFDYGENLSLLHVMRNLKSPPDRVARFAGICTMLKVVAFAVTAVALAAVLLAAPQG